MTAPGPAAPPSDLVVVGAGVVGLAHAAEALDRGLSVTVVERDDRPVGASVRNFGHGCVTAQAGRALRLATRARALLGAGRLEVRERWQGVYASAPGEFLVATPVEGARVVSVTTGIGMTTAFGLAPEVLDDLLA